MHKKIRKIYENFSLRSIFYQFDLSKISSSINNVILKKTCHILISAYSHLNTNAVKY